MVADSNNNSERSIPLGWCKKLKTDLDNLFSYVIILVTEMWLDKTYL